MEHTLNITFGTSKGRDTYGYGVVTLRERGEVKARTKGGGYDMLGTVFADWLQTKYQDRLRREVAPRVYYTCPKGEGYKTREGKDLLYGSCLLEGTGAVTLDGGCGFESIRRIAEAIGLKVRQINAGKKQDVILVTDTREVA